MTAKGSASQERLDNWIPGRFFALVTLQRDRFLPSSSCDLGW